MALASVNVSDHLLYFRANLNFHVKTAGVNATAFRAHVAAVRHAHSLVLGGRAGRQ
jgi:hypothetical protein